MHTMTNPTWNDDLPRIPWREGIYPEQGMIVYLDDPKLFYMSGNTLVRTWKDDHADVG